MLGEHKELDELLMSSRHLGRVENVRQVQAAYQQAMEVAATGEETEAEKA
jgi:hypothetical protein